MPIYTKNNKKVLFLHVPKTGGMSIGHLFDRGGWQTSLDGNSLQHPYFCNRIGSLTHLNYSEAEEYYNLKEFDFVFCVVRNPYERAISEYHWQKKTGSFNSWFLDEIEKLHQNPKYSDNHLIPQVDFVGPCTKKIYRFEQGFDNIYNDIEKQLDEYFPQKHFHVNPSEKTITALDIDKKLVYNCYKQDFETFGYEK